MDATKKQLAVVGRIGPAFSVNEVQAAHRLLDDCKVPRTNGDGQVMSLPARICWLNGQLVAARFAAGVAAQAKRNGGAK